MKRIVIVVIFLCYNHMLKAQSAYAYDSIRYVEAYNYIKNDSINQSLRIYVSDSLIDMDRFYFSEMLKKYPEELQVVNGIQKYSWLPNSYSPLIKSLFSEKYIGSKSILFFSFIEKNTLCADLILDRGVGKGYSYDNITTFNQSPIYAYLFFFHDDGTLKLVFRSEIIYN